MSLMLAGVALKAAPVSYVQIATTTKTQSGGFHTSTGTVDTFTVGTKMLNANGSCSAPSYSFTNFSTTGLIGETGPGLTACVNNTSVAEFLSSGLLPKTNSTMDLGGTGNRWANAWASRVKTSTVSADNDTIAFMVGATDTMDARSDSWQANVPINIAYSVPAGDATVQLTNTDPAFSGAGTFSTWNGVSGANMASFGSNFVGSRLGVAMANKHEFVCGGAGCVFGSRSAAPIYFGTNDGLALTISSDTKKATFVGDIVATTGTFSAPISATTGTFTGVTASFLNASSSATLTNVTLTSATVNTTLVVSSLTVTNGSSIRGVSGAVNASTGFIGEYVSSAVAVATNYPNNGVWGDLAAVVLSPGDWLVSCNITASGNITGTEFAFGQSVTSGNSAPGLNAKGYHVAPSNTANAGSGLANIRWSSNSQQTIYLKYNGAYTVGTPQATGEIRAIRFH